MTHKRNISAVALPLLVLLGALALWMGLTSLRVHGRLLVPTYDTPSPLIVARSAPDELHSGRLLKDTVASLFRFAVGFGLAASLGVPLGLWMGSRPPLRAALLPGVNFFSLPVASGLVSLRHHLVRHRRRPGDLFDFYGVVLPDGAHHDGGGGEHSRCPFPRRP